MFRRLLLFVTILSLIAAPAHAQLVVFDPGNLVQTTLIAYRMNRLPTILVMCSLATWICRAERGDSRCETAIGQ